MGALEDYIARSRIKDRNDPMRKSVMSSSPEAGWQPEYERKGGHALEAPMISPEDLIGTGLPTKTGALLAKLGAGKLGGLGLAGMVKFSPEEIASAMKKFDLIKSKNKRHSMHDGFGTDELSGISSSPEMFWGPGATKNMGKIETVPTSSITPTQYELDTSYIPQLLKQGMPGDEDILEAIRLNGKLYLQDGHHRFSTLALAGKPEARVKVANAVGTGPDDWVVKPNIGRNELDDGLIYDYLRPDVQKKLDHDYDFDKFKKSNPADWAKAQSDALYDVTGIREYPMLQGVYRGYAGDRSTPDAIEAGKRIFATPQREAAERYSTKRSIEGRDPHLEMLMVDPFAGRIYGHGVAGMGRDRTIMTQARELNPEDIQNVHQFYRQGGLVQYCNCKRNK